MTNPRSALTLFLAALLAGLPAPCPADDADPAAGMTLDHYYGQQDGGLLNDPRTDVLVATVKKVSDHAPTFGNPPVVELEIHELLRGDPKLPRRTARWDPIPHDIDYTGGDAADRWPFSPDKRAWAQKTLRAAEARHRPRHQPRHPPVNPSPPHPAGLPLQWQALPSVPSVPP